VEQEAVRLRIHQPEIARGALDPTMFAHPTARAAIEALDTWGSPAEAIEQSPPEVAEVLARLSVETLDAEPTDVLARFASESGRRVLRELEAEARTSTDPLAFVEVVSWLKVTLDALRRPNADVETVMQLVAFIRDNESPPDQG
jgi:hypothetical protein